MIQIKQTFSEVQAEAKRCLYCVDAPCMQACPASVNVPQFIRAVRYEDIKSAKKYIKDNNPLGGICGTLCPSENLCQKNCVMNACDAPIMIREIQKFACANASYKCDEAEANGKKVAVIGAGPAGIGAAATLAKMGYAVDVYEKNASAAGVVAREIPAFRIAEEVIANDIAELPEKINFIFNREVSCDDLKTISADYDAVFLGIGLGVDRIAGVEISEGAPVIGCSKYLADLKNGTATKESGNVLVVGGGDSAIDAACSALEFGADKAVLAYRRSKAEMPSNDEEFVGAARKGVELMYMVSPIAVKAVDGKAEVTFVRNQLIEKPGETRKGFAAIEGSEFTMTFDKVVFAIGKKLGESLGEIGYNQQVKDTNIFVGGDCLNGGATIVKAVGEGKFAAAYIDAYLK